MIDEARITAVRRVAIGVGRQRRLTIALTAILLTLAQLHAQRRVPSTAADGLIVGRVVDIAGRPVSGAVVALLGRDNAPRQRSMGGGRQGPAALDRVLTGADGYFLFRDLTYADYSLTATKSGYDEG